MPLNTTLLHLTTYLLQDGSSLKVTWQQENHNFRPSVTIPESWENVLWKHNVYVTFNRKHNLLQSAVLFSKYQ